MIDDPLALLMQGILLFAAGLYPLGFLFGSCSACCGESCPAWWFNFDRCIRMTTVGAVPPEGGDCAIETDLTRGEDILWDRRNQGLLTIHRVPTRLSIGVRVALSASGASRTPVGETRNQVWRFNRPAPTNPPATTYDVLGPEWHLQVDLSVTGVETEEEAGVVSSIEEDSEGQPKLVLRVNQWTQSITHEQQVTLFPVGLQRWSPDFSANIPAQSFEIAPGQISATRVSGGSISGWSVLKLQGRSTEDTSLAVRVQGGCAASPGQLVQRVILDESVAVDFLNGDTTLRFNRVSSNQQIDVTVQPKNVMCGIPLSETSFPQGVALGIFPEVVYAEPPADFIAAMSAPPNIFCNTGSIALRVFASPFAGWRASWSYRGNEIGSSVFATAQMFYSGSSLLHCLENGPARQTATAVRSNASLAAPGAYTWTFRLSGSSDPFYDRPEIYDPTCPAGVCADAASSSCSGTVEVTYNVGSSPNNMTTRSATKTFATESVGVIGVLNQAMRFSGLATVFLENDPIWGGISIRLTLALSAPVSCEQSGGLSPELVSYSGEMVNFFTSIQSLSVTLDSAASVSFESSARASCSEWTPSLIPPEGGTATRTCENITSFNFRPLESLVFPPIGLLQSLNRRMPVYLGVDTGSNQPTGGMFLGPSPVRQGACRLWSQLRAVYLADDVLLNSSPTFTVPAGTCFFYAPSFSAGSSLSTERVPCDDCAIELEIISGEEFASVTYLTTGERAGYIEVRLLKGLRGGEGVVFQVSCGNDTASQEVRRSLTRPAPPRNLTVTRGPCSEAFLEWEPPEWDGGSPVTGYDVEFRRIPFGSFTRFVRLNQPVLSATVTGLLRVGYEFRVSARNNLGGTTGISDYSAVATDGFVLLAPTGLTAAPRYPCNQVSLSWTPPPQSECVVVASYQVRMRVAGGAFQVVANVPGTSTTATVSGLTPTTAYIFEVSSGDEANNYFPANAISVEGCPPE